MVLTLMVPARAAVRAQAHHQESTHRGDVQDHARDRHDGRLRLRRSSSSSPGTAAAMYEKFAFINRVFGPYWWAYCRRWSSCNVVIPQLFWFKKVAHQPVDHRRLSHARQRRHVVRALRHHRDLADPRPAAVELGLLHPDELGRRATLAGSFGLFFTLFLLFCRYLPMVAMAEVKATLPEAHAGTRRMATLHHGHRRQAHGDTHERHLAHDDEPAMSEAPRTSPPTPSTRRDRDGCPTARTASSTASWPSSTRPVELIAAAAQGARRWLHRVGLLQPVPGARHRSRRWASR